MASMRAGRPDEALPQLAEALAVVRRLNDLKGELIVLADIGQCHRDLGNTEEAILVTRELLGVAESRGGARDVAHAHLELGWSQFKAGDRVKAEADWSHAATVAESAAADDLLALAMDNLGGIAEDRGDTTVARSRYRLALDAATRTGDEELASAIRASIAGLDQRIA